MGLIMSDFESAERRIRGSLREVQRNLRSASAGAYALHPTLFAFVAVIFAVALVEVIPLMRSAVLYATVAAVLFLILGCILYIKKGAVEAAVTFALGMFTAFTVPWGRSYFIVFVVTILLFIVLIIVLSSIKLAAAKQLTMTIAANFYTHQAHEDNLRELNEVYDSNDYGGAMMPEDRAKAVLFFAQRKIPTDIMKAMIRNVDQISTVTQVDQVKIETLLYKMYQATTDKRDIDAHLTLMQNYLLEGPASVEELVEAFIHTAFFIQDKPIPFERYLGILTDGLARGYGQERLYQYIEQSQ
jgi:lysylphosphatidylglycerol synthetase-like protein (DUF2156 family)